MRSILSALAIASFVVILPIEGAHAFASGNPVTPVAGPQQPAQFIQRDRKDKIMVTVVFRVDSGNGNRQPDEAESAAMRAKLYEMANNECAALEKAFSKPCRVQNLRIIDNSANRNALQSEMKAMVTYVIDTRDKSGKTLGKKASLVPFQK